MNRVEVAALLTWVSAVDNRVVTAESATAWAEVLPASITFDDARAAAVAHFRDCPGVYLTPAHVVAGVREARLARLRAVPDPLPAVDPDDVQAFQLARRQMRQAIASPVSRKEIMR